VDSSSQLFPLASMATTMTNKITPTTPAKIR
jgi:hypothetical protein